MNMKNITNMTNMTNITNINNITNNDNNYNPDKTGYIFIFLLCFAFLSIISLDIIRESIRNCKNQKNQNSPKKRNKNCLCNRCCIKKYYFKKYKDTFTIDSPFSLETAMLETDSSITVTPCSGIQETKTIQYADV